jgi:sec-independent protein translocase protein TatA
MFRSFGLPELLIVLLIMLLVFGASRLPQIGDAMGKAIRSFKKGVGGEEGKDNTKPDDDDKSGFSKN